MIDEYQSRGNRASTEVSGEDPAETKTLRTYCVSFCSSYSYCIVSKVDT